MGVCAQFVCVLSLLQQYGIFTAAVESAKGLKKELALLIGALIQRMDEKEVNRVRAALERLCMSSACAGVRG
jgi:hypothetical protein